MSYSPLEGSSSHVDSIKWKCPLCEFSWGARSVASRIPLCPDHSVPLQRVSGTPEWTGSPALREAMIEAAFEQLRDEQQRSEGV